MPIRTTSALWLTITLPTFEHVCSPCPLSRVMSMSAVFSPWDRGVRNISDPFPESSISPWNRKAFQMWLSGFSNLLVGGSGVGIPSAHLAGTPSRFSLWLRINFWVLGGVKAPEVAVRHLPLWAELGTAQIVFRLRKPESLFSCTGWADSLGLPG